MCQLSAQVLRLQLEGNHWLFSYFEVSKKKLTVELDLKSYVNMYHNKNDDYNYIPKFNQEQPLLNPLFDLSDCFIKEWILFG